MAPSRKTFRRLAISLTAFLTVSVLAEVALRVLAAATLRERSVVADSQLGWRYLPNVRKVGRFWGRDEPGWTNSQGWRDAETPLARDPNRPRLVSLGDSFTFGVLVDYGERSSEVLEELVPRLEVVNLAMNAIGPDQQLRILEVFGLAYSPDVVVLTVFLGNDLEDIRYERKNSHSKPWYELVDGELRLHEPVVTWDQRLRGSSYLGELLIKPFDRGAYLSAFAEELRLADTVPLFAALVSRMAVVSEQADAEFLVVLAHEQSRHSSSPTKREARAIEALRGAGLQVLDTFETFSSAASQGEQLFAEDGHWSAAGNRLVAELLAAELKRLGWL